MAEFTGQNLNIKWICTGGTLDISGDYRKVNYKPSVGLVASTAGSDAFETYLTTTKNTALTVTAVMQTGGTALEDGLVEGSFGTLIIGPEGTASGKRKYTIPAYSKGANFSIQYNTEVEFSCEFQGSGARTNGVF